MKSESVKDEFIKRKDRRPDSLKETMARYTGSTDEDLIRGVEIRYKWGRKPFVFSKSDMELYSLKFLVNNLIITPLLRLTVPGTTDGGTSNSSGGGTSGVVINDRLVLPGETLTNDNSQILNTGFMILQTDWSPQNKFVVSGIPIDALNGHQFRQSLTPLNTNSERGIIKIYEIINNKFVEYSTIYLNENVGPAISISAQGDYLCLVLANGKVCVLAMVERGVFEISDIKDLNLECGIEGANVVKCGYDSIFVGYKNGSIARFSLNGEVLFVVRPHSSIVTSISVSRAGVCSTAVDGTQVITWLTDLRFQRHAPRLRLYPMCSAYIEHLNSFIVPEDLGGCRLTPINYPESAGTSGLVTQHITDITHLATSIAHPFVASGSRDGSVHIANSVCQAFITKRRRNVHKDLELYKLECAHASSRYRFQDTMVIANPGQLSVRHSQVFPISVTITGLNWHPTEPTLISAFSAGILRLDNLCAN